MYQADTSAVPAADVAGRIAALQVVIERPDKCAWCIRADCFYCDIIYYRRISPYYTVTGNYRFGRGETANRRDSSA